jgi:hypothetical protein
MAHSPELFYPGLSTLSVELLIVNATRSVAMASTQAALPGSTDCPELALWCNRIRNADRCKVEYQDHAAAALDQKKRSGGETKDRRQKSRWVTDKSREESGRS